MPRKKSIRHCAHNFQRNADAIVGFLSSIAQGGISDDHLSWLHDYAIIRLYREFEVLIKGALVGAINNDTSTLTTRTGIQFPKHLTDDVCEYLLVGDGYFDFKGRDGLIKTIKRFVPDGHYLVTIVKRQAYKTSLERLSTLRNLAAHDSPGAKASAKAALGVARLHSAGAWLKRRNRFGELVQRLKDLAAEIEISAPY